MGGSLAAHLVNCELEKLHGRFRIDPDLLCDSLQTPTRGFVGFPDEVADRAVESSGNDNECPDRGHSLALLDLRNEALREVFPSELTLGHFDVFSALTYTSPSPREKVSLLMRGMF